MHQLCHIFIVTYINYFKYKHILTFTIKYWKLEKYVYAMLRQSFRVYGSIVLGPDELFSQIWSDLKSSLPYPKIFEEADVPTRGRGDFGFCFQTISSNLRTTSGRRFASAWRRLSPIFRRKTKFEESDSTLLARSSLLQKTEQVWGNSLDFQYFFRLCFKGYNFVLYSYFLRLSV